MNVESMFQKDIHRAINGVIKVGQQDPDSVRQELEEYVVTGELNKHFSTFFDAYTESLSAPTDRMGVWISGFFGSGKSHFLKILSYLLANREIDGRPAVEFFDRKFSDPTLEAAVQRAARAPNEVILFNIDSKADAGSKNDKEAIVRVFQKVFDEHRGYFGTHPGVAEFERNLDRRGQLASFRDAFQASAGKPWEEMRDAWAFSHDHIVDALVAACGVTRQAAETLAGQLDQPPPLSVERFAQDVKAHLDRQGPAARLLFMVDEVGQYVGENPDLMLNLQTVAEDLGVHCGGRAWVVVTSQEAMDEITRNKIKGNDFSKIQGRFRWRANMSSANTDEVIKLRLLRKTDAARDSLVAYFANKAPVLRNQISFTQDTADLPRFRGEQDFADAYPFVPYQFDLLQKVFTQIRVMGAAGKHLAAGERSLLDAFQIAARSMAGRGLGALAPFHLFYLAVEGFLDAAVRRVIEQASRNASLQPFDVDLLKTLFMIKYVKEIRGNAENLTTLSIDHVDQDRIALRDLVEGALARLERQTLVQRNGDEYGFLTNEEQDVGREIKNETVQPGEVNAELQKMLWSGIFLDKNFKYTARHQYAFNRKLDELTHGMQTGEIGLHVLTPYAESFADYQSDVFCFAATGPGTEVLVRLPESETLVEEATELVRTDKFVRRKTTSVAPAVRAIVEARAEENLRRRDRVDGLLQELIGRADVFANGAKVEVSSREPRNVLNDGLRALVAHAFKKVEYVQQPYSTEDEVAAALARDVQNDLHGTPPNDAARKDMLAWLGDQASYHHKTSIRTLLTKFGARPYGWTDLDTLGVAAELINAGQAELRHAQGGINAREKGLVQRLRSKSGLDEYTLRPTREVDPADLRAARDLASDFANKANPPQDAATLFELYQQATADKTRVLLEWQALARAREYPFGPEIESALETLRELAEHQGPAALFGAIRAASSAVESLGDQEQKLRSFFTAQAKLFDAARASVKAMEAELRHLDDPALLSNVESARAILSSADPTAQVPHLNGLLQPVQARLAELLAARQTAATAKVRDAMARLESLGGGLTSDERFGAAIAPVTAAEQGIEAATTIDGVIAREAEVPTLEQAARVRVLELLNRQDVESPTGNPPRQVVTVALGTLAGGIIESPADVDAFLDAVRKRLTEELAQDRRVVIG